MHGAGYMVILSSDLHTVAQSLLLGREIIEVEHELPASSALLSGNDSLVLNDLETLIQLISHPALHYWNTIRACLLILLEVIHLAFWSFKRGSNIKTVFEGTE